MANQTIVFLHIPKTAGSTLNSIMERQYSRRQFYSLYPTRLYPDGNAKQFHSMSTEQRAQLRLLTGHVGYGFHCELPNPVTYFTLLRDPIERVISFYYYVRRNAGHYLHDYTLAQNLSLPQFVASGSTEVNDNLSVRMISGHWKDIAYGQCTREMLEMAKQNLREYFAVVGLAERFDESLLLLKQAFGWRNVYYMRHNVTQDRPRQGELPVDTLNLIRQHNQLDGDLYDFARTLFEAQLNQSGLDIPAELDRFHRRNRIAQPYLRVVQPYLRAQHAFRKRAAQTVQPHTQAH
jgi:hypothetical protein